MFYCTTTEIVIGELNQTNWGPIFQEMALKHQASSNIIATELLPRFLNSTLGYSMIIKLRAREVAGQSGAMKTVAFGMDKVGPPLRTNSPDNRGLLLTPFLSPSLPPSPPRSRLTPSGWTCSRRSARRPPSASWCRT